MDDKQNENCKRWQAFIRRWGLPPFMRRQMEQNMEKETWIVVGLGNPGTQYAHTRHNVGFDVTDVLARHYQVSLTKSKCKGLLWEVPVGDKRLVICQPQTMMNLSGQCVAELLNWYKCTPDRVVIVYDDIDLPTGKLRVRMNGSAGTHNGMRSIVSSIATQQFPRIRVGVGAKPEGWDLVNWVLGKYLTKEEQETMDQAFAKAADCVIDWMENGIDHAMRTYN